MALGTFDQAAGTMTMEEARSADDHLRVDFVKRAVKDELLTDGGLISVRHPRLQELKEKNIPMKPYIKVFPTEDDHFIVEPAGRLICRDVEFIRILLPGNRLNVIERPIDAQDKQRFARRYDQWKSGVATAGLVGTPLAEVPFLEAAMREELAYFNIHTAEQLVELSEAVAGQFRGIHQIQARVKHWLDGASGAAQVEKMAAEKRAQEAELKATRDALQKLQAQMAELQAAVTTKK